MRTIIVYIFTILAVILCTPVHLYLYLLARKDQQKAYIKSQKLVKGYFAITLWLCGCKMTVIGRDRVPDDIPVLFVGNHRSIIDILCCHNAYNKPLGFMSKDNVLKVPILPWYMKDIGCTFLDRNNLKKGLETITASADIVKSGHSMMVFPEGHRNTGEELLPFKDGAFKIAQKAGSPIVPVAICGTEFVMEANKHNSIHRHKVIIEFLDPINIAGLKPKERKEVLDTIPVLIQKTREKNLPLATRK